MANTLRPKNCKGLEPALPDHQPNCRSASPCSHLGWRAPDRKRQSCHYTHGASDEPVQRNNPQPRSEGPTPEEDTKATGRYRFRDGEPVDPDEGVHPEMRADGATARERPINQSANNDAEAIPASPAQLIAMQNEASKPRPEKPEHQTSANVTQVMELIDKLDTKAAEDLEIAYRLVRRLESFHDEVVDDMRDDPEASHNQLISWAIDADRLMQARILLGNVDLE